jgi:hypothetical protein
MRLTLLNCARAAQRMIVGRYRWSVVTVGIVGIAAQVASQGSPNATVGEKVQERRRPVIVRPEPPLQVNPEDFRIVVLYDPDETPDAQAEQLAREITVTSILSGVKMTKADAARGVSAQGAEETRVSIRDIFPGSSSVVFFAAKQSGGDCVPPPDCGCGDGKNGIIDCVCIVWRKKSGEIGCMCRLCILGPSSPGSATGSANRTFPSRPLICIVLGDRLQKDLASAKWWENNREFFVQEVWAKAQAAPSTTNLTIKVKSSAAAGAGR